MKAKAKNKKRLLKGFTLIELLGVIIVLSILLVLVLPKLTSSVKSKKEELAMLNDDIVYTAAKLYVSEHKNEFEEEDDFVGCIEISTLDNLGYLGEEVTKYDLSNYNYNYVEVRYNNGYNYSLTNTCSPFTHNKTLCTGNNCKACYISKTYNNGVYQYEGKILESSDPSIPLDGLVEIVGYTSDYGCKEKAVIMAAEDYMERNSSNYEMEDGDVYCIGLNSPLYSEGYITNPIYNNSNINIVNDYSAEVTISNGDMTVRVIQSNTCHEKHWYDPTMYSGFVPIIYVPASNDYISSDGTLYHNVRYNPNYTQRGSCSASKSYNYGYWRVADPNEEWYNYDKFMWPNVALLKSSKPVNYHLNLSTDVIAMFVWIPRYEYKITGGYNDLISVNLITDRNKVPTSGYRIPDAFTFGDRELGGFWVAKFPTTGTKASPTVLPGQEMLNTISFKEHFDMALDFDRKYGLDQTKYDSHMMKNSEWAALAYFTNSKYGLINNSTAGLKHPASSCNSKAGYSTGVDTNCALLNSYNNFSYLDNHQYYVSCVKGSSVSVTPTKSGWNNSDTYSVTNTTAAVSPQTRTYKFTLSRDGLVSFTVTTSRTNKNVVYTKIKTTYELTDSSGKPISSGTVYAGNLLDLSSSKTISKDLGAGTYTITVTFEKSKTSNSTSATGKVTGLSIEDYYYSDSIDGEKHNGISSSSSGSPYGVYDMTAPFQSMAVITTTKDLNTLSLLGFSSYPKRRYYDTLYTANTSSSNVRADAKEALCNGKLCYGYAMPIENFEWGYDIIGSKEDIKVSNALYVFSRGSATENTIFLQDYSSNALPKSRIVLSEPPVNPNS